MTSVDKKILVTGGCGFIGSHFVKRLYNEGHDVWVLDKLTYAGNKANLRGYNVPIYIGDIASPSVVEAAANGADAIVNFAAESHVDRSIGNGIPFVLSNTIGAYLLAKHSFSNHARTFIQISTDEVYGPSENENSSSSSPWQNVFSPHRPPTESP